MSIPTISEVGDALRELAETDAEFGQLEAAKDAAEFLLKHHIARLGLESGEKSAAAQHTQALATDDYVRMIEDLRLTCAEVYTMRAQRKTKALAIDVWRSYNANQRLAT